jgi:hypothetical protein
MFGGVDELDDATAAAIQAALDEDRLYNNSNSSSNNNSGGDTGPLSAEVRAPDSVRRMNLLGGDDMSDFASDVPRMYSYTYIGTDFARPPPRPMPTSSNNRVPAAYDSRYDSGLREYGSSASTHRQRRPLATLEFDDADAVMDEAGNSHIYTSHHRSGGRSTSSSSGGSDTTDRAATATAYSPTSSTSGVNSDMLFEGIPFALPPGANVSGNLIDRRMYRTY